MPPLQFAAAIGMPLFLVAGAIAAMRASREHDHRDQHAWRDTSLDDWRRERDARLAAERDARVASAPPPAHAAGRAEESEEQPAPQQRLGG